MLEGEAALTGNKRGSRGVFDKLLFTVCADLFICNLVCVIQTVVAERVLARIRDAT